MQEFCIFLHFFSFIAQWQWQNWVKQDSTLERKKCGKFQNCSQLAEKWNGAWIKKKKAFGKGLKQWLLNRLSSEILFVLMVANIMWVTWNNADIHAQKKAQFHCAIFAKSQRSIFYFKLQEPYKTFLGIIW